MSTNDFPVLVSKFRHIAYQSLIGLALLIAGVVCALAQEAHSQMPALHQEMATEQKSQASALLKIVRDATERYKVVSVAEAEGYAFQFGCVSGPDSSAMGLHFFSGAIVGRGEFDLTRSQIVLYEPIWENPNRIGHVWAWKENPNGAFVNWHPNVSCQQFGCQAR